MRPLQKKKKERDLVWQHQDNNGICHPLQNGRVLFYPRTSQLLLWLHVGQLVLSLQRWQRSQEPIIYITLQWRRTGCSLGFLWLTLPGRIALTAHGKEERWLVQFLKLGWTWQSRKARGVGMENKKKLKPHSSCRANRNDGLRYVKVCLTTHISGESKCVPSTSLGQNNCMGQSDSSWLPTGVL